MNQTRIKGTGKNLGLKWEKVRMALFTLEFEMEL